jgi:peptidoglycan/LPS O-acetylase OafA/YrhL
MIKKFDTSFNSTSSATSSGTSGIVKLVLVVGLAYLGYRFIVKPMLDKKKQKDPVIINM